ncbi:cell wall protein DAN4 isoform X2 [Lingula anatina]|uniref:Cell wall protein DAN4 isoform X2 n=1 Tax=Lingula anatina TaxID=7574 RepID=A0A1S3JQH0_LINAN|nr:cell wall protein DAN4 isoform X2 [Lingula anatina]|eukprot:XP_013412602.1 cell wall protein DAN4 isoform X2 [Lingula anatina]
MAKLRPPICSFRDSMYCVMAARMYHVHLLFVCFMVNLWAPGNTNATSTVSNTSSGTSNTSTTSTTFLNTTTAISTTVSITPNGTDGQQNTTSTVSSTRLGAWNTSTASTTFSNTTTAISTTVTADCITPNVTNDTTSTNSTNDCMTPTATTDTSTLEATTPPKPPPVGAIVGLSTSLALAVLILLLCGLLVYLRQRKTTRFKRPNFSNQAMEMEPTRTTDFTPNGKSMVNAGASRSHDNNFTYFVKSEHMNGSAASDANEDGHDYLDLSSAGTPPNEEYSYAYASVGGKKAEMESGEQSKKQKPEAFEMQQMYLNDLP